MKQLVLACSGIGALLLGGLWLAPISMADKSSAVSAPILENLLSTQLQGIEGTEVIVSRVVMPPNASLPKHWHPGEEFAYVLEGSAIVRRDGEADVTVSKGDVAVIPLEKIHTAVTTDEGATVLVFRIHELGKPERVLVD